MQLKSIKLNKAHEHQGVKYKADTTIEVAPHTYDWLIERKVGEPATKETTTETETQEPATTTSTKKASKVKE